MSPAARKSRFEPLPSGRHKLTAEQVLESQRERLLQAMLECVGEHGYAGTTVPQVVATARVSRNGFYALFEDKLDCFLALCEQLADEILAELIAFGAMQDWRRSLDEGMTAYLRFWQDRPAFARAYLVELPSAGPRAQAQRDRRLKDFGVLFEQLGAQARRQNRRLPELSPLAVRMVVVGITEIVAAEVREGRTAKLVKLHDDLVRVVELLLAGRAP